MPRLKYPEESLLAAMLGEHAPVDLRRAARRLRAEGAPAVAISNDIAGLAHGLVSSAVSRSPAVLDALPPLFWIEAQRETGTGAGGIRGWVVEKKRDGLAARGFSVALARAAIPEPEGTAAVPFGAGTPEEDEEIRTVRGLVAAISLPEMMSQMGEASPILLMPADASDQDTTILRGFRLSVAISPDAAPG
ncbi:hypothetical protein [Roseomonas sp. BN140053]|uniref:hypothetical protein n=1 Tax=Roseomonas sp. BN140053 TaxID=3391898 RepID=UPI0039E92440